MFVFATQPNTTKQKHNQKPTFVGWPQNSKYKYIYYILHNLCRLVSKWNEYFKSFGKPGK